MSNGKGAHFLTAENRHLFTKSYARSQIKPKKMRKLLKLATVSFKQKPVPLSKDYDNLIATYVCNTI